MMKYLSELLRQGWPTGLKYGFCIVKIKKMTLTVPLTPLIMVLPHQAVREAHSAAALWLLVNKFSSLTYSLGDSLKVCLTSRMKLAVIVILGTVYGMYLTFVTHSHMTLKRKGWIHAVGQQASRSEGLGSRPSCAISPLPNLQ